ncbi:MAG: hypothetical protein NZM35_00360 [Chitinophagales bacterium]|nr:hypothetical protein [Chitinophagales bacterium]MDW8417769.1 hypothetical protein [Chitinophagales bacterium]
MNTLLLLAYLKNPPVIIVPVLRYSGMAIFPFVLLKSRDMVHDHTLMLHERIHLVQQLEMLILPFYILYGLHYLFNLILYRSHHRAYRAVIFEREAYSNEHRPDYLKHRRPWAFLRYAFTNNQV